MSNCCEKSVVTDCISCPWQIPSGDEDPKIIYSVSGLCPSASGKIEYCGAKQTDDPTGAFPPPFVIVEFLRCGVPTSRRSVFCGSCLTFSIKGFDAIQVIRPASGGGFDFKPFTLIGELCITPHHCKC